MNAPANGHFESNSSSDDDDDDDVGWLGDSHFGGAGDFDLAAGRGDNGADEFGFSARPSQFGVGFICPSCLDLTEGWLTLWCCSFRGILLEQARGVHLMMMIRSTQAVVV